MTVKRETPSDILIMVVITGSMQIVFIKIFVKELTFVQFLPKK